MTKTQPNTDVNAEKSVLGAMLINPDAIPAVLEHTQPADMWQPRHATIMDAAIHAWGNGLQVDPLVVAGEMDKAGTLEGVGGSTYLLDLVQASPTTANVAYHARRLADLALIRRVESAGTELRQLATTGGEADDILNRAQELIGGITRPTTQDITRAADNLDTIFDEIHAIANGQPTTGAPNPTGFPDLDQVLNGGLRGGQMVIIAARPGVGKALALDTPLATPTGWTTMGEVKVGDQLIGSDGHATNVVAATEVMHNRPCYEVEFSDGSTIVADAEHQWSTHTRKERRTKDLATVRTTEQIAATLRTNTKDRRLNHSIQNTKPIDGIETQFLVEPYTLGAWLGDGTTAAANITSPDEEVAERIRQDGYLCTKSTSVDLQYSIQLPPIEPPAGKACAYCGTVTDSIYYCDRCYRSLASVQARLRTIGVLGNKHIPTSYLRGSVYQRRQLLAGLMDTDGTVTVGGAYQITLTRPELSRDVYELIVSLGYRCGWTTKRVAGRCEETSTAFTLTFSTPHRVFWLSRKHEAHRERRKAKNTARSNCRYITAVRKIDSVPVRCVQVDNEDHLYLAGRSMIPTHNSTLAVDIARHTAIANDKAAVIFSLEMSRTELVQRVLSAEGGVPIKDMRTGTFSSPTAMNDLQRAASNVEPAPFFIDDAPNLNMMEIRAKARRLANQHRLGLIVVDYLQLMSSPGKVENRQQEVSQFSRQLKLLAKELDVPVIAVSQLNRGVETRGDDAKPRLSDLRESGSLEQDADIVMLIDRPDSKDPNHRRAGEADIIIAKHRGGALATVELAHQMHLSRFSTMLGLAM